MSQARSIAYAILNQVDKGRHTLDYRMELAAPQIQQLGRADRALLHTLVYGVQRWRKRLDWIIDHLAVRSSTKIDPPVRNVLRMGLFQLLFLDRVPTSAAVNTSVDLIKRHRRSWAAGFVNGLLRQAARISDAMPYPDPAQSPVYALAVMHSIPCWLTERWIERWGMEEAVNLCMAINTIPGLTLRTNTLKTNRQELMTQISPEVSTLEPAALVPEGICCTAPHRPLNLWPTFVKGWFQVQDEAAQLVAHLLAPKPGERVWDACSGMGTKTAHLAQLMHNQGSILATDKYADKLKRLNQEMQRLGITIVQSRYLDLEQMENDYSLPLFDRILVDAPCSGLGVLRKNPDGKWRIKPEDLVRHGQRQGLLLSHAARQLKPDGLMVYAVCSFEPEESTAVVQGFLQKYPEFVIHRPKMVALQGTDRMIRSQGFMYTLPHRHGMDGFFAAALGRKKNAGI